MGQFFSFPSSSLSLLASFLHTCMAYIAMHMPFDFSSRDWKCGFWFAMKICWQRRHPTQLGWVDIPRANEKSCSWVEFHTLKARILINIFQPNFCFSVNLCQSRRWFLQQYITLTLMKPSSSSSWGIDAKSTNPTRFEEECRAKSLQTNENQEKEGSCRTTPSLSPLLCAPFDKFSLVPPQGRTVQTIPCKEELI